MWQATRKAAELIKLVTYCNNMHAYCANLSCTHPHAHKKNIYLKERQNIAESYKKPMRNRHHHHHLLATYVKSRQISWKILSVTE